MAEHVQYFLRTIGSGMFWHVLAMSYLWHLRCYMFVLFFVWITVKSHTKPMGRNRGKGSMNGGFSILLFEIAGG